MWVSVVVRNCRDDDINIWYKQLVLISSTPINRTKLEQCYRRVSTVLQCIKSVLRLRTTQYGENRERKISDTTQTIIEIDFKAIV